jgi:hypothetical protein
MIRAIAYALAGWLIGYLMESFYFVSFNPSDWSAEGRGMGLTLMAIGALVGACIATFPNEVRRG